MIDSCGCTSWTKIKANGTGIRTRTPCLLHQIVRKFNGFHEDWDHHLHCCDLPVMQRALEKYTYAKVLEALALIDPTPLPGFGPSRGYVERVLQIATIAASEEDLPDI